MVYRRAPLGFLPADPAEHLELVSKTTRRFKPERLVVISAGGNAEGIERLDLELRFPDGSTANVVSGPPEAFSEDVTEPAFPNCAFFDAGTEFRLHVRCSTSRRARLQGLVLVGIVEAAD